MEHDRYHPSDLTGGMTDCQPPAAPKFIQTLDAWAAWHLRTRGQFVDPKRIPTGELREDFIGFRRGAMLQDPKFDPITAYVAGRRWRESGCPLVVEPDEWRQWYEEAMCASNEAGFAGMSAAQTIRELAKEQAAPMAPAEHPPVELAISGRPDIRNHALTGVLDAVCERHIRALQEAWRRLAAPVAPATDVRRILLDVVPGYDGEGLEVYATSVNDVEALLTKQAERIEELESKLAAHVAPALVPLNLQQIEEMAIQEQFLLVCDDIEALTEIVRAIEAAHGIKP